MHSASAGLEHLLFPELVEGPVTLTNAKARARAQRLALGRQGGHIRRRRRAAAVTAERGDG